MSAPVFLHVDMDAFYASVEQRDNPELRGRPVIVGALPGHRGVVSACSYEARPFGVRSAMPISQAYRLCPHGVYLPVRMIRYQEVSASIMKILAGYTPSLHQISVDEAFMDLTGTLRLLGPPRDVARELKRRIAEETGLTVSVGVAPSRFLAKLASEVDKPDGLRVVEPGGAQEFVASLPLKALWGVGRKTLAALEQMGVTTVVQLRLCPRPELAGRLGAAAADYLGAVSRGEDPGIYADQRSSHSISGEHTFEHDVVNVDAIERTLLETAYTCMHRLLEEGAHARTVTLKLRLADFTTFTQRLTLDHDVESTDELYRTALSLLHRKWDRLTPVRLVGCGFAEVQTGPAAAQSELFDDSAARRRRVEQAVHRLRGRGLAVARARLLGPRRDPDGSQSGQ